jgi:uncharacterized protein YecE (DUF72 family)
MAGDIRIGISGWRYAPWRSKFYPEGLRQADELAYAAGKFPTIEINGTFYSLQRPEFFAGWREQTPEGFVFAIKGGRFITHMKKLNNVETPLANFFASGLLALKEKLGPVLWQLPPSMAFDPGRLAAFFDQLPRSTREAAHLAKGHDDRLKARACTVADADRPIRHALEIRHESFSDPAFIKLLRKHKIGLVVADTVDWPLLMDATADFVYVRMHGSQQLYASGYGPKALARWADRIAAWSQGREADGPHAGAPAPRRAREVYVYFDNDAKVRAPVDALALMRLIGKRRLPGFKPDT